MSTTTLVIVLLALAALQHGTARRQSLAHADAWARRSRVDVDHDALVAELTHRLQVGAVGAGIGTLLGLVTLLLGAGAGTTDGPDGVADVAILLSSTVVCAVASEAVNVVRRTPAPTGARTAALVPRAAHADTAQRVGELVLVALAVGAALLAGLTVADGVDGARGAVAAVAGALVVIAVCGGVRDRMVRHARVARDDTELAVVTVAGDVSIDRFGENLVAGGGMLTLTSLLVPAIAAGPDSLRTAALALGVLVVATIAVLVAARRNRHQQVVA